MTIARLKKLILLGDLSSKTAILEAVQRAGIVHLIPLAELDEEASATHHQKLKEALRCLQNCPQKRRLQTPGQTFEQQPVIQKILENKRARVSTIDEIELLRGRIKALKPWGDFEYPDLAELSGQRLWFYKVPLTQQARLEEIKLPWKLLGESHNDYFLVVVAESEPDDLEVPFVRVHVGSKSLATLHNDLDAALAKLEDLDAQRESLTRWIKPLTHSLDETINLARMTRAAKQTYDDKEFFALSGWVPASSKGKLEHLRKKLPVAYTLSDPDAQDNPPTLLSNADQFGGGEAAVSFFQLPGYRSWDPSIIIFFSFALFFAIILTDAGYPAVLGLLLAAYWKKSGQSSKGRRWRNFCLAIISMSVAYGVMIGSYFGIPLNESGVLHQLKVLDINNFDMMMQLSIGVGISHLVVANIISGWHNRHRVTSLASAGWAIVISGAFALWLQYLHFDTAISFSSPGSVVMLPGMALVLLFSSDRQVRTLKDLALRFADSILAFYKLTKAFGDVLSYMRLFALGLSSASLAITFNQLAVKASESVSAGGFILFALIILFGHLLNFVLAIMSGVIHGLCLNMLEFYNWGIEGDGYPFEAFKRNE